MASIDNNTSQHIHSDKSTTITDITAPYYSKLKEYSASIPLASSSLEAIENLISNQQLDATKIKQLLEEQHQTLIVQARQVYNNLYIVEVVKRQHEQLTSSIATSIEALPSANDMKHMMVNPHEVVPSQVQVKFQDFKDRIQTCVANSKEYAQSWMDSIDILANTLYTYVEHEFQVSFDSTTFLIADNNDGDDTGEEAGQFEVFGKHYLDGLKYLQFSPSVSLSQSPSPASAATEEQTDASSSSTASSSYFSSLTSLLPAAVTSLPSSLASIMTLDNLDKCSEMLSLSSSNQEYVSSWLSPLGDITQKAMVYLPEPVRYHQRKAVSMLTGDYTPYDTFDDDAYQAPAAAAADTVTVTVTATASHYPQSVGVSKQQPGLNKEDEIEFDEFLRQTPVHVTPEQLSPALQPQQHHEPTVQQQQEQQPVESIILPAQAQEPSEYDGSDSDSDDNTVVAVDNPMEDSSPAVVLEEEVSVAQNNHSKQSSKQQHRQKRNKSAGRR